MGLQKWNIVKIPGKTAAKAETSNSTFRLKVKNCPYVNSAGVALLKQKLVGVINLWKILA